MAGSEGSAAFAEGVPCWIDAQLPDVEAGKRFYGELFGWTFEPFDKTEEPTGPSSGTPGTPGTPGSLEPPAPAAYAGPGPYAGSVRAYHDGEPVAALVPKRDGRMPTVWTVYFATPDAEDLADRIREAGGQVITAPVPVGPYGTMALAADPENAVFGLWEGGTHPGFGKRHGPGSFSWVELYARDTAVADSFYAGLFHDALFGPGTTRDFGRVLVTEAFPAEMPPHFLVHFGVDDCEALLGTVVRLGGRVQAPPFDASYGRVAVVTDNQGASFALLQT
ncbi:VOC family protein [Streptomyces phaeochromogenes]|uniref:VOC family protein n=1 Tax=Streptomyces phaeochromogenes TaxID=1923 RepID=UPI002DD98114|nr:VOC family protein [Streptomyces phaeochromogenes]WRZ30334.1 VOC family protein [Streptomyces phaeochromogenes]